MKKVFRFRFFLIAALVLVFYGQARAEAGLEMHRMQAGERDSSGWYLAKSTNGRFSVLLPLPFNDFTAPGDGKSEVSKVEVVGTKSSEGIKFSATRIYYVKKGLAKHYFADFTDGKAFPGAKRHRVKVENYTAVDVDVSNTSSGSLQRAVLVNDSLILLIVEWPKEHEETARELANTFLKSLNIDGSGGWEGVFNLPLYGPPFGPAKAVQNHSHRFCLSVGSQVCTRVSFRRSVTPPPLPSASTF